MKKTFLFLLLIGSVCAHAQSLKEALYSGKLKNQAGTVIRKGDDLASKMDTATKAPAKDSAIAKAEGTADSSTKKLVAQTDSAATAVMNEQSTTTDSTDTVATEAVDAAKQIASASKDNNAVWKAYMNTLIGSLKTEVLPSKKVKRETYYIMVSYAIGTDGQVSINNVLITPENEFLQQQIKDRLALDAPKLHPVLSSSGTPRKVTKKYSFTLTKE